MSKRTKMTANTAMVTCFHPQGIRSQAACWVQGPEHRPEARTPGSILCGTSHRVFWPRARQWPGLSLSICKAQDRSLQYGAAGGRQYYCQEAGSFWSATWVHSSLNLRQFSPSLDFLATELIEVFVQQHHYTNCCGTILYYDIWLQRLGYTNKVYFFPNKTGNSRLRSVFKKALP